MKSKRIFIGMTEIAGYYGQLTKGLREKGYAVTFVGGNAHPFGYERSKENQPLLADLYERVSALRVRTPRKKLFRKLLYVGGSEVLKILLFFGALMRHDVFIFGFGSSFFRWNLDLPLLRLFGKRVICNIAHGSDARPPYVDGGYLDTDGKHLDLHVLENITKRIKKRCDFIERHADLVLGAPLSCHFLKFPFINWLYIGLPYSARTPVNPPSEKTRGVRILHSPSHPQAKGTPRIREAIKSLKKKGYEIEFIEVIGQPNSVVLEELVLCDFVIDQIYSDHPMAGFATEAAWFGKPAVIGGYGWEILNKHMPDMLPPSQSCHPEDLEKAIEKLINNRDYREALGEKARAFVQEKWSAKCVAEKYIRLIDGDIPEEWFANPKEIVYLHGGGLPEKKVKEIVRNLILSKGVKALQLAHRPDLEQAFVEFAGLDSDTVS
ncbi:hypothetical protein [Aminivibrio sp.]|uniref:glycosyltransferase n=1 Tax=Aminivibrio sp. TaxID=1872489 RepID=UPI001A5D042C|nr:hypothetical protein [Aminivibrio sp.]MBL3538296.1 hypothetical protein [Aminivibrio sp.]